MPLAHDELADQLRQRLPFANLADRICIELKRFETQERPVIYDENLYNLGNYIRMTPDLIPFIYLCCALGLADQRNHNDNPYDWKIVVLNDKAQEMYERLKTEGYYAKTTEPTAARCEAPPSLKP